MKTFVKSRIWAMAVAILVAQAALETLRAVETLSQLWPAPLLAITGTPQPRFAPITIEGVFMLILTPAAWWAIVTLSWLLRPMIFNGPVAAGIVSPTAPTDATAWPPPPINQQAGQS